MRAQLSVRVFSGWDSRVFVWPQSQSATRVLTHIRNFGIGGKKWEVMKLSHLTKQIACFKSILRRNDQTTSSKSNQGRCCIAFIHILKLKPLLIVRKYRRGGGGAVSKMMLNTKLTICRDMYIKRCTHFDGWSSVYLLCTHVRQPSVWP